MSAVFLQAVNLSISASWLVLAVLALRLVLKKAPKWISVLLWGLVAVRLLLPISVESVFSAIPSKETISPDIMTDWTPEVFTGIRSLDALVNPIITESFAPKPYASANPLQILIPICGNLWVLGFLIMLSYSFVSYVLLHRRVRTAVKLQNNIYQSEQVTSPFVLGIIKPRIYLPFHMNDLDRGYVIAHEQAHIRRKDHWWKPFGFLLLAVYWFNPILWVGYVFLCRDIELACDEKVIGPLDSASKADYSQALVSCSVNHRNIAACPIAFGELGVKTRVRSVMSYKKPTFWIVTVALLICGAVAVCFLTDPTPEYGVGIRSIETGADDEGTPAIILDYLFLLDGEEHFHGEWISTLDAGDGELTENGTAAYNGELGAYRLMIKFRKTKPSAGFRKNHVPGQVYTLQKPTEAFGAELKYKVVYPSDYSMVIYIGSDQPLGHKDPALYNVRYLGGKMYIRLYGVAQNFGDSFVAVSGGNAVPLLKAPVGTAMEYFVREVNWLNIAPAEDALVPFELLKDAESVLAHYQIYDAETMEPLDYFLPSGLSPQTYLFSQAEPGRLYIVLARLAMDEKENIYAFGATWNGTVDTQDDMEMFQGNLRTYYKNQDGTWQAEGRNYQHRHVVTGQLPNSVKHATFVYLSNMDSMTFEQAYQHAGFSSDLCSYYPLDQAILVSFTSE